MLRLVRTKKKGRRDICVDDQDSEALIKFLSQNPKFLDRFFVIVEGNTKTNFINTYQESLIEGRNVPKQCITRIIKCSNQYSNAMLMPVYDSHNQNTLGKMLPEGTLDYASSVAIMPVAQESKKTSPKLPLLKAEGDLCVKEAPVCYQVEKVGNDFIKVNYPDKPPVLFSLKSVVTAEQKYFSLLYTDKAKIQGSFNQCLSQEDPAAQQQLADNICSKFTKSSNAKFSQLNDEYYRYIDTRVGGHFKEECLEQDSIFTDSEVVGQLDGDL